MAFPDQIGGKGGGGGGGRIIRRSRVKVLTMGRGVVPLANPLDPLLVNVVTNSLQQPFL